MEQRRNKVIRIGAAVLLGGCAYAVFCRWTGFGIPCLFHLLTGLNCPGCGVSRMLLSLLRLDFAAAFRHNAVLLCLLPVLLWLLGRFVWRYVREGTQRSDRVSGIVEWCVVGVLLVWGVVRNLIGM